MHAGNAISTNIYVPKPVIIEETTISTYEKQKEKIAKKKLKRNDSIERRYSNELKSCAGFLGKVKNGVGCASVCEDREGLDMVSDKGGIGLK